MPKVLSSTRINKKNIIKENLLNGTTIKVAMLRAGYSESTVKCPTMSPVTQEAISEVSEILRKQGITTTTIARRLKRQLDAEKKIAVAKDSMLVSVPDNQARNEAIKTSSKLLRLIKEDTYIDNRQINFSGDLTHLQSVVEEMKQLKQQAAIDITGRIE